MCKQTDKQIIDILPILWPSVSLAGGIWMGLLHSELALTNFADHLENHSVPTSDYSPSDLQGKSVI